MSSARDSIENLIYTYAERIDMGDFDGVAALFRGATYGAAGTEPIAGEHLAAVLRRVVKLHDGSMRTKHVTTNVIVEVDEGARTATARSYFSVMQASEGPALRPIMCGRYHDRFEIRDGEWRFAERVILMDLMGDISEHLNADAIGLLEEQ